MCLKTLEMCLNEYGLDPANFLTAAGSVWQACLKESKVELELLRCWYATDGWKRN